MTGRISQADRLNPCIQIGFDDIKNFSSINGSFKPTTECRLNGSLNFVPLSHRLLCHGDDLPEGFGSGHPRIFAAVCLAGGITHAEHFHTGKTAFQSFIVQYQAGQGYIDRLSLSEVLNKASVLAICGTLAGWTNDPS